MSYIRRPISYIGSVVAISVFVLASASCAQHANGKASAFKRPTLGDLEYKAIDTAIPTTKRVELKNGLTVHLLPDKELPLFDLTALIRVGSIWEPEDKAGLATITGATIRSGGSKDWAPDKLDETLEFIAGSVETSIGKESGSASLSVLSKDIDLGLKIFADVIRNPRFDPARVELAKARMLDGIKSENDDPTEIAQRELLKLIYAGSPYGNYRTLESVKSITRDDIVAFHKKYFVPQNIMIGVTGDFDENTIIGKLEKLFEGWKGPTPKYPEVAPIKEEFSGGVYLARKEIPQSVIRMGHLAGKRTDPDYHAVRVMDDILGGSGFTSRLVKSIRVDKGLAYSVWAYTQGGRWELGRYMAGTETKATSTAEAIGLIKGEMERIRKEPVTDEELETARNSIVNSFVFIFDRPSKILDQRMIIDYYDLPEDYLETYREKVMAVTADDVLQTAKRRLHPDGLKIVVVGAPDMFDRPLDEFGRLNDIELRDYTETR